MPTQELCPYKNSEDTGLIYVSPKLVTDIKDCKYGLGWETSYKNCHRGMFTFVVPHMSLFHQKERDTYRERLGRVTTTSIGDIERREGNHHSDPADHRELLQT